jgi:hypothetical protein
MKAFADLADLPEDDRIALIGAAAETGQIVGFFVDDDAKADRYIRKLLAAHRVRLIDRAIDVVVKGTVFVRVGPQES